MLPPKWAKGDLHSFHQNVGWLSLCQKNIFPFSQVELFGYDNAPNEGTINFGQNLGQFPYLPENRGMKWRIKAQDIKITPYPQLFVKYLQAAHSLVLRPMGYYYNYYTRLMASFPGQPG